MSRDSTLEFNYVDRFYEPIATSTKVTHINVEKLTTAIVDAGKVCGMIPMEIGRFSYDQQIVLLRTHLPNDLRPRVLLAAGFHGDEVAGCFSILKFLTNTPRELFDRIAISILPIVNPVGLSRGCRHNAFRDDPNRGFCSSSFDQPEPSLEGNILLKQLSILVNLSRDGFLTLHEDMHSDKFYLYTFEKYLVPEAFSLKIRAAGEKHFPRYQGITSLEGSVVNNGIIFRECDGSFEDRLFHEGVPRTACTETPGLCYSIDQRVRANVDIIRAFIDFYVPYL